MSKERLEDIKTWLNRGFDLTEEDIEWLIEQAERVQKLEKDLDEALDIGLKMEGEANEWERKAKRYKQALEGKQ